MSDYSKSTNFTAKDTLPTGNAGKIIKGTEFDIEFTNIASAVSSKADVSSPSLLGSPTAPTATAGSNTTQLANTAYVKTAVDNFSATLSTVTGTWSISTTGTAALATLATTATTAGTCSGNSATVTNGAYITAANQFTQPNYFNGSSTTNSMRVGSGSLNFYDSTVGSNANTSIFFAAGGTAIGSQGYSFSYNNGGSAVTAYQFYGDGSAQKTGGGSWAGISDARLKENVTPLTGALAKLNTLNPVSYTWKIQTVEPTVGFIAQEVETVLPNAVTRHKPTEAESQFISDQTYTVGFQADMTAYLVAAIKELKAELDVANAKITALQNA
jgi:hypothetical protein